MVSFFSVVSDSIVSSLVAFSQGTRGNLENNTRKWPHTPIVFFHALSSGLLSGPWVKANLIGRIGKCMEYASQDNI